jgi:hypothetical protein
MITGAIIFLKVRKSFISARFSYGQDGAWFRFSDTDIGIRSAALYSSPTGFGAGTDAPGQ